MAGSTSPRRPTGSSPRRKARARALRYVATRPGRPALHAREDAAEAAPGELTPAVGANLRRIRGQRLSLERWPAPGVVARCCTRSSSVRRADDQCAVGMARQLPILALLRTNGEPYQVLPRRAETLTSAGGASPARPVSFRAGRARSDSPLTWRRAAETAGPHPPGSGEPRRRQRRLECRSRRCHHLATGDIKPDALGVHLATRARKR
jgi:hypothetical protein